MSAQTAFLFRDPARVESLLNRFHLTDEQKHAARERERDVAVTAGAGSGKTRTLVARYLPLLAECADPRAVVAITFTEKAAREMRSRIRVEVRKLVVEAADDAERSFWRDIEARLDSARISTIHSLCQEILRSSPVEAALDPEFAVVDEAQSAVLRAQSVRDELIQAVQQSEYQALFALWKTASLESTLNNLLDRRLDMENTGQAVDSGQLVSTALSGWLGNAETAAAVQDLQSWQADGSLADRANRGDRLAPLALELVEDLRQAVDSLDRGDPRAAAEALITARSSHMNGQVGSGELKAAVKILRVGFDSQLGWLSAKDSPLLADTQEKQCAQALTLLGALYERCRDRYVAGLRQQGAVDFDDLEGKAQALLQLPEVAARWQAEIVSLLVDEFQDTNSRQRDIVRALCGNQPGRLFVVGDARQSIYRFRGADVTVFRGLQEEIRAAGGLCVDLDRTFRSHQSLLNGMGDLLAPIMGVDPDPGRPYQVSYTPLTAQRQDPRDGCQPPHIELVLAPGADSGSGRKAAARALGLRLLALKQAGQITSWDEVSLLFRASTGFPAYEDAFEALRIPYLTVAGRGFYDRPEIRDVLNLLRALADPWDDLVLTGLLCSPVFGMTQAGLARLRLPSWKAPPAEMRSLYQALQRLDTIALGETDLEAARHAQDFLAQLSPLVDRIPVGELLARIVSLTNYRAVLAGNSSRLWRNLDKLLADAGASQLASVQAFLEYLNTLNDAGAREGEAPAEAQGAVRLMSIHKSKGLEFEFVVLADAARQAPKHSTAFYQLPETGLALKPDRLDGAPLAYRYASFLDRDQSDAETRRLLYVALTRAKEKLIISGHCKIKDNGGYETRGWLSDILTAGGVDLAQPSEKPGQCTLVNLPSGQSLGVWLCTDTEQDAAPVDHPAQPADWPDIQGAPLYGPYLHTTVPEVREQHLEQPVWLATGTEDTVYGRALGTMVHKAVQRWHFPGNPNLAPLLTAVALESGLVGESQVRRACQESELLLSRLQAHTLWQELDQARQRLHEVPYSLMRRDGRVETGVIDIIYRIDTGWAVLDIKTEPICTQAELNTLIDRYTIQLRNYTRAARLSFPDLHQAALCFLDYQGEIRVIVV